MTIFALLLDRFGHDVMLKLSQEQENLLICDTIHLIREERHSARQAVLLLHDRIGGPRNLVSYCQSLESGALRRQA